MMAYRHGTRGILQYPKSEILNHYFLIRVQEAPAAVMFKQLQATQAFL